VFSSIFACDIERALPQRIEVPGYTNRGFFVQAAEKGEFFLST
jgi:hypothetical protein